MSQETLADQAGISTAAVSSLERGIRRAPQRATLALLAKALSLTKEEVARLEFAAIHARARARAPRREPDVEEPRNNVSDHLTSFVGRERDIQNVTALIESKRLVTILGPGGVGKTRVAAEVARIWLKADRGEAWFIDLASLSDGTYIPATIALALGEEADSLNAIIGVLRRRTAMLLILDNCEHLLAAGAAVANALIATCPHITILATSREPFGIAGDEAYRLNALDFPDGPLSTMDEALSYTAVALFVQRAQSAGARGAFSPERLGVVAEICRRLDGMPLAIELAAARVSMLGLKALASRLNEEFVLKAAHREQRAPRQQTVTATIEWSYNLLNDRERMLLNRLAIFRGGYTLEAAEATCSDDILLPGNVLELLFSLVEKNLVNAKLQDDTVRYVMLETIRLFAFQKLSAAGDAVVVARQHAEWFATFADRAELTYFEVPIATWLLQLRPEFDNVRASLEWLFSVDDADAVVLAGRIVGGLRALWILSQQKVECRKWLELALERISEEQEPLVVARLYRALIQCVDGADFISASERARPLFERVDPRGLVILEITLTTKFTLEGRFIEASRSIERAYEMLVRDRLQLSGMFVNFLIVRGALQSAQGDVLAARADILESIRIAKMLDDGRFENLCFGYLASIELEAGNVADALEIMMQVIDRQRIIGLDAALCPMLSMLATCLLILGRVEAAEASACEMLSYAMGRSQVEAVMAIQHLAAVAASRGNIERARRLSDFVDAWCLQQNYWRTPVEKASQAHLNASFKRNLSAEMIIELGNTGADLTLETASRLALEGRSHG